MFCRKCGASLPDATKFCTVCGAPAATPQPAASAAAPEKKKPWYRPHIAVRIVMQVLSFLLCMVLTVSLLVSGLLLDLRALTSSDGLEDAIAAVLGNAQGSEAAVQRSEESLDAVVDIAYDIAAAQEGVDLEFSKEDLRDFVEASTVPDFLADKLSGYAVDILQGTENTQISTDELMGLLEENEEALEAELGISLTDADKQALRQELHTQIEEKDLNGTIHQTVNTTLEEELNIDMDALRQTVQWLTGSRVMLIALLISLLLILLLCGLNYYNVGAGLTWSAVAGLSAGSILMLPVLLAEVIAAALVSAVPELAGIEAVIHTMIPTVSNVHIWMLVVSAVVLLIGIGLRITFWILRRRRANAPT